MIYAKAYNIDYDAPAGTLKESLPDPLFFEFEDGTEDIAEVISDAITDATDFCHNGFDFDTSDSKADL